MPTSTLISIGVMVLFMVVTAVVVMMRMKKGGGMPSQAGVGGPEAAAVRADLKRGDTASLRGLLVQPGLTWDDRTFYVDLLAGDARPMDLDFWVQSGQEPDLALLARGRANMEMAWQARGRGQASSVTAEGQQRFEQYMAAAQQDLHQAAQLQPADPSPWAFLLEVVKVLDLGMETAQQYYQHAVSLDPQHYKAHALMLGFHCQKWGGSHEQMFQFAYDAANRAGPGSDLHTILLYAHIERWLYFDAFEDNAAGAKAYLKDPRVIQETLAAYQNSLGSPQLLLRRSTIHARNTAAFWFFLTRQKTQAQMEIAQIGNAYTELPWALWDTPAKAYSEASQWAYGVF